MHADSLCKNKTQKSFCVYTLIVAVSWHVRTALANICIYTLDLHTSLHYLSSYYCVVYPYTLYPQTAAQSIAQRRLRVFKVPMPIVAAAV
jgi:hypothetical protein